MYDAIPVYHISIVLGVGPRSLEHRVVVEETIVQLVKLPV